MFFKKSTKFNLLEEWNKLENQIESAINSVNALADPAEKILKLHQIGNDIEHISIASSHDGHDKANDAAAAATLNVVVGSFMAIVGFSLVAITMALPPVTVLMAAGAGISGIISGVPLLIIVHKKYENKTKGHLQKMESFKTQIAKIEQTLIKDQSDAIIQSPFLRQVLRLPGLSEAFSGSAEQACPKRRAPNCPDFSKVLRSNKPMP